ncbi:MAG: hypothetical protein A2V93_09005 [Ignavibacteria bacterium RBG_16_34_14]|nr:MAG: hypothetical protein A2V93_09005 [Ignavibacteria bacterium RBG_16_34_14]
MKKLLLILSLGLIICLGCDDELITPIIENNYGVYGTIIDTSGKPVSNVSIFYLFNYSELPNINLKPNYIFSTDSLFENKLFQNIPNPVYEDTYIRFSLDSRSVVELKLKYKLDGKTFYTYKDTLPYGMYQHYLDTLGRNTELKNGIYKYQLKIKSLDGFDFFDEKELVIVSVNNKPNSFSNDRGEYFFNGSEAFVGDTINVCSIYYPDDIYKYPIEDEIYLLFRKDGYLSKTIKVKLYPGIRFTQDVVLEKEGKQ